MQLDCYVEPVDYIDDNYGSGVIVQAQLGSEFIIDKGAWIDNQCRLKGHDWSFPYREYGEDFFCLCSQCGTERQATDKEIDEMMDGILAHKEEA
jgi:hypothetical protein